MQRLDRRSFLCTAGWSAASLGIFSTCPWQSRAAMAASFPPDTVDWVREIADSEIRTGVTAAIFRNLLPAAGETQYPGHFSISADGAAFGGGYKPGPGLDSWQMTGAYLLLGRHQLVLDYFAFVRASQRPDGNIPFAIFPGSSQSDGKSCGRGIPKMYLRTCHRSEWMHPPVESNDAAVDRSVRALAIACQSVECAGSGLLTCSLRRRFTTQNRITTLAPQTFMPSLIAAAKYVRGRSSEHGLIGGSGFYMEMPPRDGWDGVTQCYVVRARRELSRLCGATGDVSGQKEWAWRQADEYEQAFVDTFCAMTISLSTCTRHADLWIPMG